MAGPVDNLLFGITEEIRSQPDLWRSFFDLCNLGPRFCGTPSERLALEYLEEKLKGWGITDVSRWEFDYTGWRCDLCELSILAPPPGWNFGILPLVYSAGTGVGGTSFETIDLGFGTPEDFGRAGDAIRGRAVIVDADYSFATQSIHRRRKFLPSVEGGAAALFLVNPRPGRFPVTGSTMASGSPIPVVGISKEDGALLRRRGGRVHLNLQVETVPAQAANLIARLPGRGGGRTVTLSAHYDGHNCGESALDNATGVAVALEMARLLAPCTGKLINDLEIHFFTVEEWGLQGSRAYADSLSEDDVKRILLNLNLDVVAGSPNLTFLCNGFSDLAEWTRETLRDEPAQGKVSEWVAHNSDHANFLRRGIPSIRLLAGLNEEDSDCGFHLSPADTTDKVQREDLSAAAAVTARVLLAALDSESPPARTRTGAEAAALLPHYGFAPPPGSVE